MLTANNFTETSNQRRLHIFSKGPCKFAVSADELSTIVPWRRPTPLPQAPPAVLGVVSIQGRMLTVLDPVVLLKDSTHQNSDANFIVALRGDEQLALAVDEKDEVSLESVSEKNDEAKGAASGFITHNGETITVLDLRKLFGLAIRGRERRQRRF